VRFNCPVPRLTQADILQLQQYDWPGNVRELQNVIERAVITARSGVLRFDVPRDTTAKQAVAALAPAAVGGEPPILSEAEIRRRERENIQAALRHCHGRIYGRGGAAALLGLRPTTLASRIKRLGLQKLR
jgi:DNA-binding NtrC family response regulator